jgi:ATP-binding cassette subfamily A (ABC1) protein 3
MFARLNLKNNIATVRKIKADFLGDRVAIMSHGSLKCCGSPLYLKSKYGSGYNITLTKKRKSESNMTDSQNLLLLETTETSGSNQSFSLMESTEDATNKLINLVKNMIPNAKLNSNINSEISFILPTEESGKFAQLFERLEKEKENLSILNIGISITTLEDVFLRIGENENAASLEESHNSESEVQTSHQYGSTAINNSSSFVSQSVDLIQDDEFLNFGLWTGSKNEDRLFGVFLVLQQFYALFVKRVIHTMRNKALIISQLVIPIAALLINLIYFKYAPIKPEDSPPLAMNLSRYSRNFAPFTLNRLGSEAANTSSQISQLINELSDMFTSRVNMHSNSRAFNLENTDIQSGCSSSRDSIDSFLACMGRVSLGNIIDSFVFGVDFNYSVAEDRVKLVAHFNNQPFHVPPLVVNTLTTSLFNQLTNSTTRSITVSVLF